MNHDPEAWARLGRAIRDDRRRQGLKHRAQLVERIKELGDTATERSIGSLERGAVPKTGEKPPTLETVAAALGWRVDWADRILNGEDPAAVLDRDPDAATTESQGRRRTIEAKQTAPSREVVLETLPRIYRFGRDIVALGGDPRARDVYEEAVHALVDSLPASSDTRRPYALAAYRPHAEGQGPAADDEQRILDAVDEGDH